MSDRRTVIFTVTAHATVDADTPAGELADQALDLARAVADELLGSVAGLTVEGEYELGDA